MNNKSL
jgi:hypothetical protein